QRSQNAATTSVPGLYYSTEVKSELIVNYSLTAEYMGQTDVLRLDTIEKELSANGQRWETSIGNYDALPATADDRQKFAVFEASRAAYVDTQREILKRSSELDTEGANELWRKQLSPQ